MSAFFSMDNIYLLISLGFLLLENVSLIVWGLSYGAYRFWYRHDAGAYIERANGGVIYYGTRARIWLENHVKKVKLAFVPHRTQPAPTLDAIMIGNKGPRIEYFIDRHGNAHQVRPRSRFVPVLVEDKGELRQLCEEVRSEPARKNGWVSKLPFVKGMFVKQVKGLEDDGLTEKVEFIAVHEVVFEPDDTNDKAWAYNELKENFNKHQTSNWDQFKGPIIIGIVAVVAITGIMFSGYYISKIVEHSATQCNTLVTNAIAEKLGPVLGVA